MKDLLFLCHRLPYPPNKGDKIRSYHILRHLCASHRVHLVTFIDDENDEQYVEVVKGMCASVHIKRLHPIKTKVKALLGLVFGGSFSDSFYRYRSVQKHVDALIAEHDITSVFCYSTPMAQYVDHYPKLTRCMDFVDMDSYKWKQYAQSHRWPMSLVFATEFKRLLAREKQTAESYNATWFVTPEERALFVKESQCSTADVGFFRNGVDQRYFDAHLKFENPYPANHRAIVFTGAMDYYANADAVTWFANEVFPSLLKLHPDLHFYIVGSKPVERVKALAERHNIHVTGRVPDVRPYLQHAALATAPMRIARGLQNKVLEGLAMGKVVISTAEALEGLQDDPLLQQMKAQTAAQFVQMISTQLQTPLTAQHCVEYIKKHYDWAHNLAVLDVQFGVAQTLATNPQTESRL